MVIGSTIFSLMILLFDSGGTAISQVIQPTAVSHLGSFWQLPQHNAQINRQNAQIRTPGHFYQQIAQQQIQNLLLMRSCPTRPKDCTLSCSTGFAWGLGSSGGGGRATCLCICQVDPCINKICGVGEVCVSSEESAVRCVSLEESKQHLIQLQREIQRQELPQNPVFPTSAIIGRDRADSFRSGGGTECPRLIGGICTERCRRDADCQSAVDGAFSDLTVFMKCCNNGCGHECVLAAVIPSSSLSSKISTEVAIPPSKPVLPSPVSSSSAQAQIHSNLPITPIRISAQDRIAPLMSIKPGQCPPAQYLKERTACKVECTSDSECAGVEKCCESSCGRMCAPPEKASNCVHLLSAVERLNGRSLASGFVPSCSPRGSFNPIQCDREFCWCVGPESGNEIYGTKLLKQDRAYLNCREIRSCGSALQRCALNNKKCEFGFRTDEKGCPLTDCSCRNLCHDVECENKLDECQLVEPDCARPPCIPVPKCLLNPCPSGMPMTLPNGVTALCRQAAQCWDGFWCHEIGYNGLGFCCPDPQAESRYGTCISSMITTPLFRQKNQRLNCSSECKSDSDCPTPGKCCFDGCGLKCTFDFGNEPATNTSHSNAQRVFHPFEKEAKNSKSAERANSENPAIVSVQLVNKELLSSYPKLAKCPSESNMKRILQNIRKDDGKCSECQTDSDCQGMQMCCSVNLGGGKGNEECRICTFSQSTTRCLHDAITFDFYERRSSIASPILPFRCKAPFGDFDGLQCNGEFCFCVDKLSGMEIAGARIPVADLQKRPQLLQCQPTSSFGLESKSCSLRRCENANSFCPSNEFIRDENGCSTCQCVNSCANLLCEDDEVCILAKVDCVSEPRVKCPPQPRCISNFCPNRKRPFMSSANARNFSDPTQTVLAAEQCTDVCPIGFWCNNIGLPGAGGICCPQESSLIGKTKNYLIEKMAKCPQQTVLLIEKSNDFCSLQCVTNEDCSSKDSSYICCFNGCGTRCINTANEIAKNGYVQQTGIMRTAEDAYKIGECLIPMNRGINRQKSSENCALHNALAGRSRSVLAGVAIHTNECSRDADCPSVQKCCVEGCSGKRKCQFAYRNTACLHLKAAFLQISQTELATNLRCTVDGAFATIQCDFQFCWCVDENFGDEIEGTRVSATKTSDCRTPRKCEGKRCPSRRCPHGFEKDSRGCNTCECANPCKDIKCPDEQNMICIPEPVECLRNDASGEKRCPYVPTCVPNVCGSPDAILIRNGIFRPEFCRKTSDCPENYYCRILNNNNGFCCFGDEPPSRAGRCPILAEWAMARLSMTPELCKLECSADSDCGIRTEKCCFNGCGLSCMPALAATGVQKNRNSKETQIEDRSSERVGIVRSNGKIGQCGKVEMFSDENFCKSKAAQLKGCSNDEDCSDGQKCCENGCRNGENVAKVCTFPTITTQCLHARAAALLILKTLPNNIFQPSCDANGDFEHIQRHNGIAWCVDTNTGREIQGTKSASILLTDCSNLKRKSCPILSCTLDCAYGYETDLLGCQLCACKNPCRDVRCAPQSKCQMTRVKCLFSETMEQDRSERRESCTSFVPRCILNTCPDGEPLQDDSSKRLFDCDDGIGRVCPRGWFCQKLGIGYAGYCCRGSVDPNRIRSSAKFCPAVLPILGVDFSTSAPMFGGTPHELACRFSEDCPERKVCCFNGRDTSCVKIDADSLSATRHIGMEKEKGENGHLMPNNDDSDSLHEKEQEGEIGECPANIFRNAGCQSDCAVDADCQRKNGFLQCCPFGCGRRCQFAQKKTSSVCINVLSAVMREADKLLSGREYKVGHTEAIAPASAERVAQFVARNEVQCTLNGLFRQIQCNVELRQCWCVDVNTGIEFIGTRVSSLSGAQPNCLQRRICGTSCAHQLLNNCEYGVRVDANGCPLNGKCTCKDACDNFECVRSGEICVAKLSSAFCGGKLCPPVPTCVPNPCISPNKIKRLEYSFGAQICQDKKKHEEECGRNARCKFVTLDVNPNMHEKIGVCCSKEDASNAAILPSLNAASDVLSKKKMGFCPLELGVRASTDSLSPAKRIPQKFTEFFDQQKCSEPNECDSDENCSGTQKCCEEAGTVGCRRRACQQPFPSTNCINTLAAVLLLQRFRIPHSLHAPFCDVRYGNYHTTQCDNSEGWCWCVDKITGRPVLGTRRLQPTYDVCTLATDTNTQCSIQCDAIRVMSCPFGLETDRDGCPKTSNCHCRSPCAEVKCQRNQICVLRARPCQEEICLPVPVCDRNPCVNGQSPALEPHSNSSVLICHENNDETDQDLTLNCPTNFYCSGSDENGMGVCCPGKESTISTPTNTKKSNGNRNEDLQITNRAVSLCLNGRAENSVPNLLDYFRPSSDIKEADGSEFDVKRRLKPCRNTSSDFMCKRTHFCTGGSFGDGVCCPTNRYICSLPMDAGYGGSAENNGDECGRITSARFYFDGALDACMQFIYGGCGGNLNNFIHKIDCERFCLGREATATKLEDDAGTQLKTLYTVGFSMKGPTVPSWSNDENRRKEFESALKEYAIAGFGSHLRDVDVSSDGLVHIKYSADDDSMARQDAENVIDAVSSGNFQLRFDDGIYRAEPQTVFSQQHLDPTESASVISDKIWDSDSNGTLFWIITMSSLLFALVIVIILCCGYNFLRIRTNESSGNGIAYREVSPAPFATSYSRSQQTGSMQIPHLTVNTHHRGHAQSEHPNNSQTSPNNGYSSAATVTSTTRHLKVVSLAHHPRPHVLTISNYNNTARTQNPDNEQKDDQHRTENLLQNRRLERNMLLTPVYNSSNPVPIRQSSRPAPPPPTEDRSMSSSSSTEDERKHHVRSLNDGVQDVRRFLQRGKDNIDARAMQKKSLHT